MSVSQPVARATRLRSARPVERPVRPIAAPGRPLRMSTRPSIIPRLTLPCENRATVRNGISSTDRSIINAVAASSADW